MRRLNNKETIEQMTWRTGIPQILIKWRIANGFPMSAMAATELVDGRLVAGTFDMPLGCLKKPEENVPVVEHMPRHTPGVGSGGRGVRIVRKRSKLKKLI